MSQMWHCDKNGLHHIWPSHFPLWLSHSDLWPSHYHMAQPLWPMAQPFSFMAGPFFRKQCKMKIWIVNTPRGLQPCSAIASHTQPFLTWHSHCLTWLCQLPSGWRWHQPWLSQNGWAYGWPYFKGGRLSKIHPLAKGVQPCDWGVPIAMQIASSSASDDRTRPATVTPLLRWLPRPSYM